MELNSIKDAFDRVAKKQKLCSSKSQETVDQVGHEIEQALATLQSPQGPSIPADQKSVLTELKSKLSAIGSLQQLEGPHKELNSSLAKYQKLLEKSLNTDISKAYRNVEFDTHIINQIIASHFYRLGLFDLGDNFINEAGEPNATVLRSQFLEMHQVIEAMRGRNLQPALTWVSANSEKLAQIGSNLELKVHTLQYVEVVQNGKRGPKNYEELLKFIQVCCEKLISSRPTAVNLRNAILDIQKLIDKDQKQNADATQLIKKIQDAAYQWFLNERAENDLLLKNATICVESNYSIDQPLTVITVCNTGSLATSSHGTALGVIRQLHFRGRLKLAIALETRPYNQGSRLTSYELLKENIPFVLIADNMAAAAMQKYKIDAVLVGADQVALNGDTANKIGTYMLSVLASYHRVPFYVVTPTSSINSSIKSGNEIRIEERPPQELITFNDKLTAPKDTPVWNPAFDVTPGTLITGILTEKGNFAPENLKNLFH